MKNLRICIFILIIVCIIILSKIKIIRFFKFGIPTLWWKITGKKDPLIKEALWGKTLEEYDNYYLLKKNWKLLGIKIYLDKTIRIEDDRDATFTANSCLFVNRGCKSVFEVIE